jgi:hypothetical protein
MGETWAVKSWLVASCLAVVGLGGAGCGDPVRPGDTPVHYQFALAAFGGDTTAERARSYDCVLYGFFDLPQPVAPNATARFPVKVERRLFESRGSHNEMTRADTSIAEAVLDYSGLGEDSLSFVLTAGPYTVSLGPGGVPASEPYEYAGEWTCGPAVPLGQDSTLLTYGWDPDLQIAGTWRVSEILPID